MKRPLQVLLVEDSESDAALLELALARAGYQLACHRVETAEALSAALQQQKWDLIISDYRMPQFNGLAALALVKEQGLDLPFIIVSGLITEDTAVAAMKAGAHDYVMKDNLARLGPAVERELREAEMRGERRRSEAQLGVERSFRAAIENSVPAGVAAVDLDGRQTYVNPSFCAMVGRSQAELIGVRRPFAYWPPEEVEAITRSLDKVVRGKAPAGGIEMRFCRPDGERLDVLVQITPLKDAFGNVTGWVSSASDITERKRAESRLAAEHSITRILAKAASLERAAPSILRVLRLSLEMEAVVLWLVEPGRKLLQPVATNLRDRSPALEALVRETRRLTFASGQRLPGQVWEERQAAWVTSLPQDVGMHRQDLAVKAGMVTAAAFPIQTAGDCFGVLEFFGAQRLEPNPTFLNMMAAIGSEIAQFIRRRMAEETVRRMYGELETRVEERTADLKTANTKLETAIAERKRLEHEMLEITEQERRRIGLDLHDDLGQTLSGLALMTKGLHLKLAQRQAAEAHEAAEIHGLVQQTMSHARELAQDLAELEGHQSNLPAALDHLAAHAAVLFKISCRVRIRGSIPPLESNVVRQLYKIVQESVTNAIKHAKAKRVAINLSNGSDRIVLSVRNNGRPFPDLKRQQRGMGLRIMSYRASLIGASLEIKAAGASGTRVTCSVPLSTAR